MSDETIADYTTDVPADLQLAISGAEPLTQPLAKGLKEHRREPRFRVKWPTVVVVNEQKSCRGLIKDISTKGAAVFLDINLQSTKFVNLHIYLPPLNVETGPHIIEVYGKVIYSVHDSNECLFRSGITFLKYHQEPDQTHLNDRLTKYHVTI
ncbi:MAG: hypothetical protein A3F73_04150 [Gallionellales bacterium RIFCSPLOWO2_12_FULL_59_22]|nr:MAG: hypothetical protein A3H99_00845 [Gallionellales bacterium RIFCSPLOWO2_02_FULL_59_110]OGT03437.1 MAG: hypothetical protein A2Z65_03970 [Gallionellales bacterium RIFCSPLOWO2_02_58_13]OGT12735.1 MAG: hypothetical protein A3F73_04150 [Gallionellales bacterium RIFCSPLOWO2_12_FULL_59_22]